MMGFKTNAAGVARGVTASCIALIAAAKTNRPTATAAMTFGFDHFFFGGGRLPLRYGSGIGPHCGGSVGGFGQPLITVSFVGAARASPLLPFNQRAIVAVTSTALRSATEVRCGSSFWARTAHA